MLQEQGIGLYVHVPFCAYLCPYCSFYKKQYRPELESAFLRAIQTECESYATHYPQVTCRTLYLGGGTPNALSVSGLDELLEILHRYFNIQAIEKTVELNPDHLTNEQIDVLVRQQFDRVSLGVQSVHETELSMLGRPHRWQDVQEKVTQLRDRGIANVSLDLMFSLPNSTVEFLTHTLETYMQVAPNHISAYSLTIEPGTPFHQNRVRPVSEDDDHAQFCRIQAFLENQGYTHYEISSYAKPGFESKHNSAYWNLTPYIGLGPGAHSFFKGHRYRNISSLSSYYQNPRPGILDKATNPIDLDLLAREYVMLRFRTKEGLSLTQFHQLFHKDFTTEYTPELNRSLDQKLLELTPTHVRTTPKGMLLADAISREFL